MSERDLVIIRRHLSSIEAHTLCGFLAEQEVRASVLNEFAAKNIEAGGISTHGVMLAVWTPDVERANALLDALDSAPNPLMTLEDDEAWLRHQRLECPKCGGQDVGLGLPLHLFAASLLGAVPLLMWGMVWAAVALVVLAALVSVGRPLRCTGCGAHGTRAWFEGR